MQGRPGSPRVAWTTDLCLAETTPNILDPAQEYDMTQRSEEEQRRILEAPPRGTWTLILLVGLGMLAAWLYFFFGLFMSHGPVN